MALRWTLLCSGLWMLLVQVASQLSEDQKQEIVTLHKTYRSAVTPKAADMLSMTWDEELAVGAADYATKCIWDHNPDVMNEKGENLYITTGSINVHDAITKWFEEYTDYNYDNNTCAVDKMCGHYTQLVWATTTSVGCGMHVCEEIEALGWKNATMLVCNYLPPGNVEGQKPYEEGEPCSKCPEEMMECAENVCIKTDGPSVEPTGLLETATPDARPVEASATGTPSGAPLVLTGLLGLFLYV